MPNDDEVHDEDEDVNNKKNREVSNQRPKVEAECLPSSLLSFKPVRSRSSCPWYQGYMPRPVHVLFEASKSK